MGAAPAVMAGAMVLQGYLQGVAMRRKAQTEAQILERNALIARTNAGYFQTLAQQQGGVLRDQAIRLIARSMVQAAAGGVSLTSGSLQDIVAGSWTNSEVHVQTLLNDAWRKAWGIQTQADTMEYQAGQARKEGDAAMFASMMGAGAQAAVKLSAASGSALSPAELGAGSENLLGGVGPTYQNSPELDTGVE